MKRRERDSNPRWGCPHYGFQDRRNRPLCHPSTLEELRPPCCLSIAERKHPVNPSRKRIGLETRRWPKGSTLRAVGNRLAAGFRIRRAGLQSGAVRSQLNEHISVAARHTVRLQSARGFPGRCQQRCMGMNPRASVSKSLRDSNNRSRCGICSPVPAT